MIWHRLARDLGRTVAEAKHTTAWPEFLDWCAFYELEARSGGGGGR